MEKKTCGKNGWVPSSHNGTSGNIEAEDVSKWQKMGNCTPDVDRTAKARDGGWVTVDYFGSVSWDQGYPGIFFGDAKRPSFCREHSFKPLLGGGFE